MLLFERWVPSPDLDGYVVCQSVVIMSRERVQCSLWALGRTMYIEYGWLSARSEWRGFPTQFTGPIPLPVLGRCPPLVEVGT